MPETTRTKILITGGDGFVGRHLVNALSNTVAPDDIVVGVLSKTSGSGDVQKIILDVTDLDLVESVIADHAPTHLVHLAAVSSVVGQDIRRTWAVNVNGTLNIALGIARGAPNCRLIHCSSAEVYGGCRSEEPLNEFDALNPLTFYGASKAAADILVGQFAKSTIRAITLRPFNHTGPGQSEDFAIPAFAAQIARIERGDQEPILRVGDLSPKRDLLDVQDVVDCYVRVVQRFDRLQSGNVVNICSGRAVSMQEVLDYLLSLSTKAIEVRQDESRTRRNQIRVSLGDPRRAHELLGWTPSTELSVTLQRVYNAFLESL